MGCCYCWSPFKKQKKKLQGPSRAKDYQSKERKKGNREESRIPFIPRMVFSRFLKRRRPQFYMERFVTGAHGGKARKIQVCSIIRTLQVVKYSTLNALSLHKLKKTSIKAISWCRFGRRHKWPYSYINMLILPYTQMFIFFLPWNGQRLCKLREQGMVNKMVNEK